MPEQNPNPAAPPAADAGQAPGNQQGADQNPANPDVNQPGANQDEQKTEITLKELNELKRNAGRWDAHQKKDRDTRRASRRQPTNPNPDDSNLDQETLSALRDRDEKIQEMSSENFRLKTESGVRRALENEEYKDISSALKSAIIRNPLGFTNPESKTVEDAIADIEDYLDDELDAMSKTEKNQQLNPANQVGEHIGNARQGVNVNLKDNTPPATGSGPSSPQVNVNEGIEGKVGPDRSATILTNLLKGRK